MDLLLSQLAWFAGIAVLVVVAARQPVLLAVAASAATLVVAVAVVVALGADYEPLPLPLLVLSVLLATCGLLVAMTVRRHRLLLAGLSAWPRVVAASPPDGIARLVDHARRLGFVPSGPGIVLIADLHLGVLVDGDGHRLEVVQRPQVPAAAVLHTALDPGPPLVTVPFAALATRAGQDVRVHRGAALDDLLVHHRSGVADRVAAGARVVPADAATALERVIADDRNEMVVYDQAPWRISAQLVCQQLPLLRRVVPPPAL